MGSSSTRDEFNPRFLYIYHGLYGEINSMPWPVLFNRASPLCSWDSSIDYMAFSSYSLLCTRRQIGDTDRKRRRREQLPWNLFSHTTILNPHQPAIEEREREKRDYDKEESSLPVFIESSFVVQEEGRFYVESSASSSLPHNPVPYVQPPSQPYLSTHLSRYITRRERHNIITIKYSSDVIILIAHHPHLDTNYIQLWLSRTCPKVPPQQYQSFRGFW